MPMCINKKTKQFNNVTLGTCSENVKKKRFFFSVFHYFWICRTITDTRASLEKGSISIWLMNSPTNAPRCYFSTVSVSLVNRLNCFHCPTRTAQQKKMIFALKTTPNDMGYSESSFLFPIKHDRATNTHSVKITAWAMNQQQFLKSKIMDEWQASSIGKWMNMYLELKYDYKELNHPYAGNWNHITWTLTLWA